MGKSDGNSFDRLGLRPDQRGGRFQMNRRRFTKNPGYFAFLPRVFPYHTNLSVEDAIALIVEINNMNVEGDYSYALTRHTRSIDGHVTLWLCQEAFELLERFGLLKVESVNLSDGWASR